MAEKQGQFGSPWLRVVNVVLFAAAFALSIERQAWIGAVVTGVLLVFAVVILVAWIQQRGPMS